MLQTAEVSKRKDIISTDDVNSGSDRVTPAHCKAQEALLGSPSAAVLSGRDVSSWEMAAAKSVILTPHFTCDRSS